MPTYEYLCKECGYELEAFQRMTDKPLTECPACHKAGLKRKISGGAGIIFKGSGFYQTDYRSADYQKAKESDKPAAEPPKTEPKKADPPKAAE